MVSSSSWCLVSWIWYFKTWAMLSFTLKVFISSLIFLSSELIHLKNLTFSFLLVVTMPLSAYYEESHKFASKITWRTPEFFEACAQKKNYFSLWRGGWYIWLCFRTILSLVLIMAGVRLWKVFTGRPFLSVVFPSLHPVALTSRWNKYNVVNEEPEMTKRVELELSWIKKRQFRAANFIMFWWAKYCSTITN